MRRVGMVVALLLLAACGSNASAGTANSPVIARVGTQSITQHQLDVRLESVLASLHQGGAPTPSGPHDPMLERVRANVLLSLISDAVIAQEAAFRHVAVTDSQVEAEIRSDQASAGGAGALQTQLAEAGGSLAQLTDEIRSKDNETNLENYFAQQRVQSAMAALSSGQGFASVAAQYSDDASTAKGGDMGALSLSTLTGSDPKFANAIESLYPGETTPSPVRDQSGYEILHLDAHNGDTWSIHRVLVSAPQPYTVQNRPQWFAESLLGALSQLCAQNRVTVYVDPSVQPCNAAASTTPTP